MYRVVITNHGKHGKLVATDLSYRTPYAIYPGKKEAIDALTLDFQKMLKDLRKAKPNMEYKVKHKRHIATIYQRNLETNACWIFKDYDVFEVVSSSGQISSNATYEYRGHQISPIPNTNNFLVRKMDETDAQDVIAKTLQEAFRAVDSKFNRSAQKPTYTKKKTRKE